MQVGVRRPAFFYLNGSRDPCDSGVHGGESAPSFLASARRWASGVREVKAHQGGKPDDGRLSSSNECPQRSDCKAERMTPDDENPGMANLR